MRHIIDFEKHQLIFDYTDSGKNEGLEIKIFDLDSQKMHSEWFDRDKRIDLIKYLLDTI